ncbi:MAG TPA: glycosyltransferase [Gemmataceae bacterium]|nr:glycosyltransferase [Gemmataceae bacterium]
MPSTGVEEQVARTVTPSPAERPLRVLSNIPELDHLAPGDKIVHRYLGASNRALSAFRIFFISFRYDVLLLDGGEPYLWLLCLLRWLLPFSGCRFVSVDIMFVKPVTWKQRLAARLQRVLLKRVDHFIHYFKDLDGYNRYFGITPERSTYVPFKVNSWEGIPPANELSADGDYIITGGRSLRDLDTFLAAMRLLTYPAVLLYHDRALMEQNGTPLSLDDLPANVRPVEDDGSMASWLERMRGAKLIVLTTLPSSIRAIGVSSYLVAMALKKCVVMTDGPATHGILSDEAILVPPADPVALADAIRRAWEDSSLRERTAEAGRRYAEALGGSDRLLADVLAVCERVARK